MRSKSAWSPFETFDLSDRTSLTAHSCRSTRSQMPRCRSRKRSFNPAWQISLPQWPLCGQSRRLTNRSDDRSCKGFLMPARRRVLGLVPGAGIGKPPMKKPAESRIWFRVYTNTSIGVSSSACAGSPPATGRADRRSSLSRERFSPMTPGRHHRLKKSAAKNATL
jgi:hypothetical protein